MKRGRLFYMAPMVWILSIALLISAGVMYLFNPIVCYIELGVSLIVVIIALSRLTRQQRDIDRYMRRVVRYIDEKDQNSLSLSPLPVAVITDKYQILWHNTMFQSSVMDGRSCKGKDASEILADVSIGNFDKMTSLELELNGRHYIVYVSRVAVRGQELFVLYYLEITQLHLIAEEYAATRPIAMLIYIDNLEEMMQRLRDSERARIASQVENALEDWFAQTTGILRKYDDDRFIAVVEKRHLQQMIDSRFDILERVRAIPVDHNMQITVSIGVGDGVDFRQAEKNARQAIEMALGRGGDQAAVHTQNGFEFYGGLSKGIEKRNKVRTRIMASALRDIIMSAENVLVTGHRFSDLDCVGSGLALTAIARALGKPAHFVVNRKTTLAEELFARFDQAGRSDMFIEPKTALSMVRPKTLLIVTDTQNPQMLESIDLFESVQNVAVVDHHRKMNDHIDNAVLFYHEAYSSSACEMVAELIQYLDIPEIDPLLAEALLSGIMLDTRNFVIKAGVRTFEAAAFLRKLGADTVSVKRVFAGSMDLHRKKSEIMSSVQFYRQTAIACTLDGKGADLRIACSQAADELLSIKNTMAAFALFEDAGCVNISARSYGEFNVQLVMEYLGGGGHLTMAGVQLRECTMKEAIAKLQKAIDRYYEENITENS